jgi:hypothetical protein
VEYVTFHLPSGESMRVFIRRRKPWDQKKEEMMPERKIRVDDGDGQGSGRSPAMRCLGFRGRGAVEEPSPSLILSPKNIRYYCTIGFYKSQGFQRYIIC